MKVTVTHLKAPWPDGAAVGHVVELPGVEQIPGWAAGKCCAADDDSEVNHVWAAQQAAEAKPAAAGGTDPDQAAIDAKLRAAAEQEAADLRVMLETANALAADKSASLEKAMSDLTEQGQKLAAAEVALAAAEAAAQAAGKKAVKG